jgi:hypothetical protein
MTEQMKLNKKYKMQGSKASLKINSYIINIFIFYENEISHFSDPNTVIFTISPSILHL